MSDAQKIERLPTAVVPSGSLDAATLLSVGWVLVSTDDDGWQTYEPPRIAAERSKGTPHAQMPFVRPFPEFQEWQLASFRATAALRATQGHPTPPPASEELDAATEAIDANRQLPPTASSFQTADADIRQVLEWYGQKCVYRAMYTLARPPKQETL